MKNIYLCIPGGENIVFEKGQGIVYRVGLSMYRPSCFIEAYRSAEKYWLVCVG
jgi:hypothetical protein